LKSRPPTIKWYTESKTYFFVKDNMTVETDSKSRCEKGKPRSLSAPPWASETLVSTVLLLTLVGICHFLVVQNDIWFAIGIAVSGLFLGTVTTTQSLLIEGIKSPCDQETRIPTDSRDSTMNARQKICLLIAMAVIAGMLIYPPWRSIDEDLTGAIRKRPAGYLLIFVKPDRDGIEVDGPRLWVQWVLVGLIAASLIYVFRDSKAESPRR
jgi:hypothetical protein